MHAMLVQRTLTTDLCGACPNNQHGVRSGSSCQTQLISLVEDIFHAIMDDRFQTDLILLDFNKAFNTVPHLRLLNKL